jgi:membrane-associated HD superfamily phosphohydrolase
MNINFQEKYKNYTNQELLQITQNPADYQEGALLAANTILSERNYTGEEHVEEQEHYLTSFEKNHTGIEDRIENLKSRASKFFKDLAAPLNPEKPVKYINSILLITTWFLLSQGYQTLKNIMFVANLNSIEFYPFILFDIVIFIILATGVYYFSKHEKKGWICLYFFSLFLGVTFLLELYQSYKQENFIIKSPTVPEFLYKKIYFIMAISGSFFLLFHRTILSYYAISKKIILNTTNVSLLLFFGFLLYTWYL